MNFSYLLSLSLLISSTHAFLQPNKSTNINKHHFPNNHEEKEHVIHEVLLYNNNPTNENNDNNNIVTSRFPTSPEDQVRQASIAIHQASQNGIKRHSIRLLLPIIGATELDDWPGGARQMMDAASPLIQDVLRLVYKSSSSSSSGDTTSSTTKDELSIQESIIDPADGVRALFSQGRNPVDDACAILLPSADTVSTIQNYDEQVGPKRNLLLVNTQWRRRSDFSNGGAGGSLNNSGDGGGGGGGMFGSLFGSNTKNDGKNGNKANDKIEYVQEYEPTFHCSNVMVEGDIVRILRTYPGPWRVYLRTVVDDGNGDESNNVVVDWVQIGTKDVMQTMTKEWEEAVNEQGGNYDGGKLFDYGMPSYREIEDMIVSRDGYVPKSVSQRAASAFTFIKDSL